jgi:nitrogen fixation/metabolism regulation signal transduction histidine kinase
VEGKERHIYAMPLRLEESTVGAFVVYQGASHIRYQLFQIYRNTFLRVLIQVFLISLVTLVIVRWSVMGPIAKMAEWMKQLRAGEVFPPPFSLPKEDLFGPIAREVTTFARHLSDAKAAVEEEARLRQTAESLWTAERLKEHVKLKLNGNPPLGGFEPRTLHAHARRTQFKMDRPPPAGW